MSRFQARWRVVPRDLGNFRKPRNFEPKVPYELQILLQSYVVAKSCGRAVERIGDKLGPALLDAQPIEVGAREHPLVIEIAVDRIRPRALPAFVVLDHPLDEAEPRRFLFGRG